ncbi:MAG: DUF456 domain-containing protein [Chlorobi bacterium]|nr:DUF456 domain-containing protein [Chlorobiota bacterium]
MEIAIALLGLIMVILGIAGCILPVLPGPHLAWAALLLLQLTGVAPPGWNTVWLTFFIATAVQVLDYVVPALGTKKFGGSKYGVYGATIGLLVGLFTPIPFGVVLGPFLGAFIGEMLRREDASQALKAALGSLVGFLFSVGLKLGVTLYFGWIYLKQIMQIWQG